MEYVVVRVRRRIGKEIETVEGSYSGGNSADRLRDAVRVARSAASHDPGITYRVREGHGEEAPLMYEATLKEKSYGGLD